MFARLFACLPIYPNKILEVYNITEKAISHNFVRYRFFYFTNLYKHIQGVNRKSVKSTGERCSPLHTNSVFTQVVGERLNFCFAEIRRPACSGLFQHSQATQGRPYNIKHEFVFYLLFIFLFLNASRYCIGVMPSSLRKVLIKYFSSEKPLE